jgi:hypothetical protein
MLPVRKPRGSTHLVFGVFGGMVALAVVAAAIVAFVIATDSPELVVPDQAPVAPAAPKRPPPPVAELPSHVVTPPVPEPPKPVVKPARVTLDVVTDPPGATVVLDGVRLGKAPYHAEVPAKATAWLKVRRFDRIPVRIKVSLDRDVTWNVKLRPRR